MNQKPLAPSKARPFSTYTHDAVYWQEAWKTRRGWLVTLHSRVTGAYTGAKVFVPEALAHAAPQRAIYEASRHIGGLNVPGCRVLAFGNKVA